MQSHDQDHRCVRLASCAKEVQLSMSYRFMGLQDLMSEIKQDANNFLGDESMEFKVLQQVLKLVEDKISEVKNQAVKW